MFLPLRFRGLADDEALTLYVESRLCDRARINCGSHSQNAYSLPPDLDRTWQATCSEPCRKS